MANNGASAYTGESGVIKFSDDSSAVVAIASVRNFTVDQEHKRLNLHQWDQQEEVTLAD